MRNDEELCKTEYEALGNKDEDAPAEDKSNGKTEAHRFRF
jgi:hypothetical protein